MIRKGARFFGHALPTKHICTAQHLPVLRCSGSPGLWSPGKPAAVAARFGCNLTTDLLMAVLCCLPLAVLQQAFYVWKQKPGERITVWQFWQRLQEAGLAFWPGRDTRGERSAALLCCCCCCCIDACLTGGVTALLTVSNNMFEENDPSTNSRSCYSK